MSKKDGTFFNMKLTQTQKEIMDFISDEMYGENTSKAAVVIDLVRNKAYEYLQFDSEELNFSDEILLLALLNKKKEEDMEMIRFVGVENFKVMLEEYKEKNGINDYVKKFEKLVKEYEEKGITYWLEAISTKEVKGNE